MYVDRVMIAAVVVLTKLQNDKFFRNQDLATVAGLTLQDLNALESEFLTTIDYHLHITAETYQRYCQALQ